MHDYCKKVYAQHADTFDNDWKGDYDYVGIRFEDKDRNVGDVITDKSRNNVDREDERDFPEYGTEEYREMEELDGISAWDMTTYKYVVQSYMDRDAECSRYFLTDHCYILASDNLGNTNAILDVGEIVMKDAIVIAKVF